MRCTHRRQSASRRARPERPTSLALRSALPPPSGKAWWSAAGAYRAIRMTVIRSMRPSSRSKSSQRQNTRHCHRGQGVQVEGVRILRSGQRRGITRAMKAMIKRLSAIEPTIGHMNTDGRLSRNPLKGALGDALHAVLCGAGHNIRLMLKKLHVSAVAS